MIEMFWAGSSGAATTAASFPGSIAPKLSSTSSRATAVRLLAEAQAAEVPSLDHDENRTEQVGKLSWLDRPHLLIDTDDPGGNPRRRRDSFRQVNPASTKLTISRGKTP